MPEPDPVPVLGPLHDEQDPAPVLTTELVHRGMVWDLVADTFDLGEAGRLRREYVAHTGAVAVLALDDADRVLLVRQYRHPVRAYLWELPAGLLDVDGEAPHVAAARELHEEADAVAARWDVLVDYLSSPGGSTEALRIYLARAVSQVPEEERHERHGEELGMPSHWVPLDDVVDGVLAGTLNSPSLVVGALAAAAERSRGWTGLRPADAPWEFRAPGRAAG
jgi:8-oxo-dGTP pyrophosphatase MutT (NUDIX family)